jgi:hypothetical protein
VRREKMRVEFNNGEERDGKRKREERVRWGRMSGKARDHVTCSSGGLEPLSGEKGEIKILVT